MYSLHDFIHGTIGIVASYVPGKHQVEKEEAVRRLNICYQCPHMKENNGNFKCGVCGCYLKNKTKLKKEKCPKHLW